MHTTPTLTVPGLEQVYDQLATAIDAVGPDKTELFLVKLALMKRERAGRPGAVPGAHRRSAQRPLTQVGTTAVPASGR